MEREVLLASKIPFRDRRTHVRHCFVGRRPWGANARWRLTQLGLLVAQTKGSTKRLGPKGREAGAKVPSTITSCP
jgi:hypothetical protein